jgi:hypothetical protein
MTRETVYCPYCGGPTTEHPVVYFISNLSSFGEVDESEDLLSLVLKARGLPSDRYPLPSTMKEMLLAIDKYSGSWGATFCPHCGKPFSAGVAVVSVSTRLSHLERLEMITPRGQAFCMLPQRFIQEPISDVDEKDWMWVRRLMNMG